MTSPKTAQRTPGPWAATMRAGEPTDWVVYVPGTPLEICQMFHDGTEDNEEGEANAAFIVKAVNNHDALVEALRDMLRVFGETQLPSTLVVTAQARAALKALED
jgi:hypothetical protein